MKEGNIKVWVLLALLALSPIADAAPQFRLLETAPGVISRTQVESLVASAIGAPNPLLSAVSELSYARGFAGTSCSVFFALDSVRSKLVIYHYESESDVPHFVFTGGQGGGGASDFRYPADICTYGVHYGSNTASGLVADGPMVEFASRESKRQANAVNWFQYRVYVADAGNARIRRLMYYTHQYDALGALVPDEVVQSASFTLPAMKYPNSVDFINGGQGSYLAISDPVADAAFFMDSAGNLLWTVDALSLGVTEFSPIRVAIYSESNADYLAFITGESGKCNSTGDNIVIVRLQAGQLTKQCSLRIESATDVEATGGTGFQVLDRNGQITTISPLGHVLSIADLAGVSSGIQNVQCIAANGNLVALGTDYDSNSGLVACQYQGAIGDVEVEDSVVFANYEPIVFRYTITKESDYTVCLKKRYGAFYRSIPEAPTTVGNHAVTFYETPTTNAMNLYVSVAEVVNGQIIQEAQSSEFTTYIAPIMEFAGPQPGAEFCDAAKMDILFDISYPELSGVTAVDAILETYFGHEFVKAVSTSSPVVGRNSLRMVLPDFGQQVGCQWRYALKLRATMAGGAFSEYSLADGVSVQCCTHPDPPLPDPIDPPGYGFEIGEYGIPEHDSVRIANYESREYVDVYARNEGNVAIEIFDVRGRLVRRAAAIPSSDQLSVARVQFGELASGVYFVRQVGDRVRSAKKFVVVR